MCDGVPRKLCSHSQIPFLFWEKLIEKDMHIPSYGLTKNEGHFLLLLSLATLFFKVKQ